MKRLGFLLILAFVAAARGETVSAAATIDLPTALRLAGANNLDIQLAREKVAEAVAEQEVSRARFFPWITPAIAFRRHENNIQTVDGNIIDVDKQSLSAGLILGAEIDLGDAYYRNLAARQIVRANDAALRSRQREMTYRAASAYFELVRTRAVVGAGEEAFRIAAEHARQADAMASAGLSLKGDIARVVAARERSGLELSRMRFEQRAAAARLAELLHLDPAVDLQPLESDLAPLSLTQNSDDLASLVSHALATRPEIDDAQARLQEKRALQRGAVYGPLVPTLGAQVAYGGLGGGIDSTSLGHNFDVSEDYNFSLSWRVGPGGLFDRSRRHLTAARARMGEIELEKTRDGIRRQIVEVHAQVAALRNQLVLAQQAMDASDQAARSSRERRATGVSVVFEDLQSEEELARARRDYLSIIAEYNQAQYALRYAAGQ